MSFAGHQDFALYRRLLQQARPYGLHLFAILLLNLLTAPLALLTPVPLKLVVDSVLGGRPLPVWLPAGLAGSSGAVLTSAALLLVVTTLLTYVQALGLWLLQTYTGEKLVLEFRSRLFSHVQRLSLSYHDMKGSADSAYRIQYDAPAIQHILVNGITPLLSALATLAGMIWVTARMDWQLALVALCVSPVLFLLTRHFGRHLRSRWKDVKKLDSSANAVVQEVLASVRVVKAFGREDHEHGRFVRQSTTRMRKQLAVSVLEGAFDLLVGVTIAAGTAATLYLGAVHVRAGILTLGELLMVLAYVGQLYGPLKTLSKKVADLQGSMASAERAFALLDELPEVTERPNARSIVRSGGAVSFRDVSFSYDKQQRVLQAISFDAPPGTRVGIQGRTGAGKSTLMSLLMRFYDVNEGQVLLDGVDVRDYRLVDLRNQFAIVLQDPVLFSTSIAENIGYGFPGATRERIEQAARLANAHDFIRQLPEGYETQVGERGMRLSGGERQRISLARAFLKDAPILILDEPTSSVDVGTESIIMEALERLMRGRTTFIIAHRLSTLQTCDLRLEIQETRLRLAGEFAINA